MNTERNIIFERGAYWVSRERDGYAVNCVFGVASEERARFSRDVDGLSKAIFMVGYCAQDKISAAESLALAKTKAA